MTKQPFADPHDLQHGKAAAEKEESLDELIERGESPERLIAEEHERRQSGDETSVHDKKVPGSDF